MSFNNQVSNNLRQNKKKEPSGPSEKLLKPKDRTITMTKPVVVPSSVNMTGVKKMSRTRKKQEVQRPMQQPIQQTMQQQMRQPVQQVMQQPIQQPVQVQQATKQTVEGKVAVSNTPDIELKTQKSDILETAQEQQPVKRGRGRPRKNPVIPTQETVNKPVKRGRGRPRKNAIQAEETESTILPGIDTFEPEKDIILPGFENTHNETMLPGMDTFSSNSSSNFEPNEENSVPENNEDMILPGLGMDDSNNDDMLLPGFEDINTTSGQGNNSLEQSDIYSNSSGNSYNNTYNHYQNENYNSNSNSAYNSYVPSNSRDMIRTNNDYVQTVDISSLLTSDKKIVTFVGTSKNGTSFIVNNVAELLSSMGINVAILDATVNRNSYYIYTKNEEALRNIASNSIAELSRGIANGIQVNKNLTVFTSLPDEIDSISKVDEILETLVKNYSLILIDCDFNTPIGYFKQSLETYLVQSLDILTIQPLTAFLRELKAKNILDESKLKIILNKFVKIRGVNEKTIIGGMAFYNDPAMSFMTELFDRNLINYITIPFEEEIYIKYLEGIINCEISLKGYSKTFMQVLKALGNMIYPTVSGQGTYRPPTVGGNNSQMGAFSPSMNDTLNQMKRNY